MAYVTKINGYDIKDSEARGDVSTLQESMTTAQGDLETLQNDLSDTKTDLGDVTQLETTVKTSTVNAINEVNAKTPMINTTWSALKALRDDGNLVKGMQYRITDFVTTTVQADTQSAGHAFDVIVVADSESVLNENARAALHAEDTYFANSKLNAWKLKYCLDNDSTRFAWADATNGKGVIYQMVDEFDNDLPYDFKNMQFKRYKVTRYLVNDVKYGVGVTSLNALSEGVPSLRWGLLELETAEEAIADNSATWYRSDTTITSVNLSNSDVGSWKIDNDYDLFILSDGTAKWFYTFSGFTSDSDEVTDSSLLSSIYKNKIGWGTKSGNTLALGKNVFIGSTCFANIIGDNCFSNTLGDNCFSNTIKDSFYSNTIGSNFNDNTIGRGCSNNTVNSDFYANTIGTTFSGNAIGAGFNYNQIGDVFQYNTLSTSISHNIIGDDFHSNAIYENFSYNVIGCNFSSNAIRQAFSLNKIGNGFSSNMLGNNFSNNSIGNSFSSNTISTKFSYNVIGNGFRSNTIGSNFYANSISNSFTNITIGNYYQQNHFEDGCSNLNFTTNGSPSGTNPGPIRKYRVLAGTAPSSAQTVSVTAGNAIPYNVKQTGANAISVAAA